MSLNPAETAASISPESTAQASTAPESSTEERVVVELGERRYPIVVDEGLLAKAGELIAGVLRGPSTILVTDSHLAATDHLRRLEASLDAAGITHHRLVLPPGETTKSLASLETLLDQGLACGIERGTAVIAFGGGVIGDIAGFAAAILLRGLDLVQIPTTLLAQVDSAVGGKTGINSRHGKNLIGSFHQPRLVLIDTDVLDSLPPREIRAGYAEVVKYGLIDRPDFFAWLESEGAGVIGGDAAARRRAVVTSCIAKAAVVAADEHESGQRALLNLGHTFGHALERLTGYSGELLHGEAVAIGTVLAFRLSARLGLCPDGDVERVIAHFEAVGLPTTRHLMQTSITTEAMLEAMRLDKKAQDGWPRFVLVRGIGKAFAGAKVEPAELAALLDATS